MTKDDFKDSASDKSKTGTGDKKGAAATPSAPLKPRVPAPPGPKPPFGAQQMSFATSIKILPPLVAPVKDDKKKDDKEEKK